MTTPDPKDGPTQAQIEAAKALHRYEVEHGYITREWGPTSDDENVYMAMAQAALTAAAEAGPQYAFNQPKTRTPTPDGSFVITAAAEAGEQAPKIKGREINYGNAHTDIIVRKEIAATIEGCAQVCDELAKRTHDESVRLTAISLAAAIRAMKEGVAAAGKPKDDPEKQTLINNDW